jgi:transposase InsO family protein
MVAMLCGWLQHEARVGLHAYSRCVEESGPSRRALDGCTHLEGGRHPIQLQTADDLADIHACALAGAPGGRFFTTEVWTHRGLLTYYTAFIIELHSRRVHVLGTSTHPDNAFVMQALRGVAGDSDIFRAGRFLICDHDPKWSRAVEELLRTVGVRVVRTPASAPNCNAHAERFIRSIKTECLDRVVPLGEWHLRHLLREFIDHIARNGIIRASGTS